MPSRRACRSIDSSIEIGAIYIRTTPRIFVRSCRRGDDNPFHLIPAIPSPINSARNSSPLAPITAVIRTAVAVAWIGVAVSGIATIISGISRIRVAWVTSTVAWITGTDVDANALGGALRRALHEEAPENSCVNLPDTQWMAGDDCREVKQQSGPSAKLMGRWRSGAPLVLAPDKADPDAGAGPLRGRMSLASHRVRSNHPAPGCSGPALGRETLLRRWAAHWCRLAEASSPVPSRSDADVTQTFRRWHSRRLPE